MSCVHIDKVVSTVYVEHIQDDGSLYYYRKYHASGYSMDANHFP